jgi:hypothetical protein
MSTIYTYNNQHFNADVSYTNTSTLINTSGLVGISGGIVSISGGVINISGPSVKFSSLGTAVTTKQLYVDNTGLITKGSLLQGLTGANGTNGTNGIQGPTGPQGSQGPTGSQGSQGPTGSTFANVYGASNYLGIGRSPSYPLDIINMNTAAYGKYPAGYFDSTGEGYNAVKYTTNGISAYISNWVQGRVYMVYSDKRIKNNIVDINDDQALQTLRLIKPKTYEYVNKIQRGNDNVIGFIAQEIKEILPKAVNITKDYIPNFYTKCNISVTDSSSILLVTSPVDLSWIPLHDDLGNECIDTAGNACSDASGNKAFKIRFYDKINNEIECKTTVVLDKRRFLMDISGSTFLDASGNIVLDTDGLYFLQGQEIDDFHNLDKAAIFTVVTAAVQDIDRHQQMNASNLEALESDCASLEAQIATLKQEVNSLNK